MFVFEISFGNHNGNYKQVSATNCCTGDALLQLLTGCHSSVTVLTANTTQINEICTPRNLFLMVRVANTLSSEMCKNLLKHENTGKIFFFLRNVLTSRIKKVNESASI